MAEREPSQSELLEGLHRKQGKQRMLLAKLEKAAARLERRKDKLRALEATLADLERRTAEPRREHLAQHVHDGSAIRAPLIFNPTSGPDHGHNAERLAQIVTSLRTHGIEPQVDLKTSGSVARELARDAVQSGHPLLIVAAGDGTIADVASQLVGTPTALGIIPIGTMNNIARSLGVPVELDDACALIGMGTIRHIDVGRVISNGGTQAEYFVESAGVGLSAIAAMTGQDIEKHRWHLVPHGLRRLFESKPGTITVEMDGIRIEAATRLVTVANAPLMGNHLLAAPGAKMDDGLLDVHVYDGMSEAGLAKHFMTAASGKAEDLRVYRVRHVRITAEEAIPANSGTHITGPRHVIEIEVVPRALSVIAGNGIGLSLPVESAPPAPPFAADPPRAEISPSHNGSARADAAAPAETQHAGAVPPEGV